MADPELRRYGKVRDYYMDLWGMRKVSDDGRVSVVEFSGSYGDPPEQVWLRGGLRPGEKEYVDHVGYTIQDFDAQGVPPADAYKPYA